jgi:lysophospholipase L1-like esterase
MLFLRELMDLRRPSLLARCVATLVPVLILSISLAAVVRADNDQQGNNGPENKPHSVGQMAVVGDSLSAGFQNGTLMACQQVNGYANLIAQQAGAPLVLPLIGFPGLPPITSAFPPVGRLNPLQQATNLAVPGQTTGQALTMTPVYGTPMNGLPFDPSIFPALPADAPPPAGVQSLTNFILGFPGVFAAPQLSFSQVQWANLLGPDTVIVWLGTNDIIGKLEGVQTDITNPVVFAQQFDQVLSSLSTNKKAVVVANLPDTTLTPLIGKAVENNVPLRLTIQGLTLAYNAIITRTAARYGAPVVDIYGLVNSLAAKGFVVNGRKLTTQPLGGLFSLDGLHPSNTGYAIFANEFIKTMNSRLGSGIPLVDIKDVAATDPLVPGNLTNPPRLCTVP